MQNKNLGETTNILKMIAQSLFKKIATKMITFKFNIDKRKAAKTS